MKRHFLDIGLTKSFAVCNFGNTYTMRLIFVLKCPKIDMDFKNEGKDSENGFVF